MATSPTSPSAPATAAVPSGAERAARPGSFADTRGPIPVVVLVDHGELMIREMAAHVQRAGHLVELVRPDPVPLARVSELRPDLVVLNLDALGAGGLGMVPRLRSLLPRVPVVLVSRHADESVRIRGLAAGADDFLPLPTSPVELAARVRAVLRRTFVDRGRVLTAGPLVADELRRRVEIFGAEVRLTMREFDVLVYLMRRPQHALRREQLLQDVWGYTFGDASTVTVHMRRLRSKVELDPSRPTAIRTVRGVGYLFDPGGTAFWSRRAVEVRSEREPGVFSDADPGSGVYETDVAHALGKVAE